MSRDIMQGLQDDFVGRHEAAAYFSDVAIIALKAEVPVAELAKQKGVLHGRAGKVGACVLVRKPVLDVVDPNVPGPRCAVVQQMIILEHPTINAQSNGTGKSAEQLAIASLRLCHHWVPYGVSQVFVGERDAILPDDGFPGLSAYVVTLTSFIGLVPSVRVQRPTIDFSVGAAPATVTLACGTVGAAIWYTTDESYPSSVNPAATLYSVPFVQATAATIRAAGELAGHDQGDVAQKTLT
jgi:hypothetical protein